MQGECCVEAARFPEPPKATVGCEGASLSRAHPVRRRGEPQQRRLPTADGVCPESTGSRLWLRRPFQPSSRRLPQGPQGPGPPEQPPQLWPTGGTRSSQASASGPGGLRSRNLSAPGLWNPSLCSKAPHTPSLVAAHPHLQPQSVSSGAGRPPRLMPRPDSQDMPRSHCPPQLIPSPPAPTLWAPAPTSSLPVPTTQVPHTAK